MPAGLPEDALPYWLAMAVFVALLLWAEHGQREAARRLFKPLGSATFVLSALALAPPEPFALIMLVGFALAAGGDVLLLGRSRGAFLAGLGSFLLGHVAYATAFAVRGLDAPWTAGAAALLAVAAVPILRWLWPHVEPAMRRPVAAYVLVITAMVALAAGTVAAHGRWELLAGATAFYLSDLAVARDRFVSERFSNRAWGLPLYFFAQLLLATSLD